MTHEHGNDEAKLKYTSDQLTMLAKAGFPRTPQEDLSIYEDYFDDSKWQDLALNTPISLLDKNGFFYAAIAIEDEEWRLVLIAHAKGKTINEYVFAADMSRELPAYRLACAHANGKKDLAILDLESARARIKEGKAPGEVLTKELKRLLGRKVKQTLDRLENEDLKDGSYDSYRILPGSAYTRNY